MNRRIFLIAICLLAVLPGTGGRAYAQLEGDSVEEGREALSSAANFPWYNEADDSLRRIDVKPTPPPKPPQQKSTSLYKGKAWKGISLDGFFTFLWWATVVALGVGLVAIVIFSIRYLSGAGGADGRDDTDTHDRQSDIDRIENLPVRVRKPFADLLSEARRCYEAGNYNEAIIYLYSYQLVHLDKRHLIRLAKGKTNRQYVREVRRTGEISKLLATTMLAFEEVFFGNHNLPRPRFEDCWNHLDQFHHMVDQYTAA